MADAAKSRYLDAAVEAALAGRQPVTPEAPAIGCRIRDAPAHAAARNSRVIPARQRLATKLFDRSVSFCVTGSWARSL
jgi:hypothetical protein